jgi:nitrite reductase/ring-hydroxylating ferredoxin subunit
LASTKICNFGKYLDLQEKKMDTVIGSVGDLPPGNTKGIGINGKKILVANLDGKYFAIGDICTHMGCLLSDGMLREGKVQCPCHGSTFDLKSGAVVKGPANKSEPTYDLKIDQDRILANF